MSRNQILVISFFGSLWLSDFGDVLLICWCIIFEIVVLVVSFLVRLFEGIDVLEDGFDDYDEVVSLREEVVLC